MQRKKRCIEEQSNECSLALTFAIPDHPWVDSADGAAVRIAMTVAAPGRESGRLCTVMAEKEGQSEGREVALREDTGRIHADLSTGANIASVASLHANGNLSNRGFQLFGAGFIVTAAEAAQLESDAPVKPYRNGRDLTDKPREVKVIDLFGHSADEARRRWPATYQHVLEQVKPERDHNARATYRDNWWIFGEPRKVLRKQLFGLSRYIATVETAKHRVFQFLDARIAPDNMLIAIALDDAYALGVLSSRVHAAWALAAGGRLGMGNDPRYNKSRCFETFPFPVASTAQQARIGALADELDAHRKRVLAQHDSLTLTSLYNVLEKLRAGTPLNPKEKTIHDLGLVAVMKSLHDDLDAAVLEAYGWTDLGPRPDEQALLSCLVDLNAQRATEEETGVIRWLRPDFQHPAAPPSPATGTLDWTASDNTAAAPTKAAKSRAVQPGPAQGAAPWPDTLPAQMAAVAQVLANAAAPLDEAAIAVHFKGKGKWKARLPQILDTLVALGRARPVDAIRWRGAD